MASSPAELFESSELRPKFQSDSCVNPWRGARGDPQAASAWLPLEAINRTPSRGPASRFPELLSIMIQVAWNEENDGDRETREPCRAKSERPLSLTREPQLMPNG